MKGLSITALIVSLIALAVAVAVLLLWMFGPDRVVAPVVNTVVTNQTNNETTVAPADNATNDRAASDPYKDWERYTTAHGHSLRYPGHWTVSDTAIDDYSTLEEGAEVGGNHFAVEYVSPQSQGFEGPPAWAGGGAKVQVIVDLDVPSSVDAWVQDIFAEQAEEEQLLGVGYDLLAQEDVRIDGVSATKITYDGGIYGGGYIGYYLIKDGVGYAISLFVEDVNNPPAEALRVAESFEAD